MVDNDNSKKMEFDVTAVPGPTIVANEEFVKETNPHLKEILANCKIDNEYEDLCLEKIKKQRKVKYGIHD